MSYNIYHYIYNCIYNHIYITIHITGGLNITWFNSEMIVPNTTLFSNPFPIHVLKVVKYIMNTKQCIRHMFNERILTN